jgi:hypothetical protein
MQHVTNHCCAASRAEHQPPGQAAHLEAGERLLSQGRQVRLARGQDLQVVRRGGAAALDMGGQCDGRLPHAVVQRRSSGAELHEL